MSNGQHRLPLTIQALELSLSNNLRTPEIAASTRPEGAIVRREWAIVQGWSFFIYQSRINLQLADGKLANSWVNYAYEAEHLAPLPIVSDNQWHHLAVTINRDELDGGRWYVDGVEVGQGFNPTTKQSSLSTHIPLTIGRRSDSSGTGFQGNIGDIRLYRTHLRSF